MTPSKKTVFAQASDTHSTPEFDRAYACPNVPLGVIMHKNSCEFHLWAPGAASVLLRLHEKPQGHCLLQEIPMEKNKKGLWNLHLREDVAGQYYTYLVTTGGRTLETVDPYAKAVSFDGKRGLLFRPTPGLTEPQVWQKTRARRPEPLSPPDCVIWEIHVRDFSMDPSVPFRHRGEYLAFTETGLTNQKGQPVGLDHLVDLGITHIQLLPVFDFDNQGGYNWGYNPRNWFAPSPLYATDPTDPACAMREFKAMVQALHAKGIGVIMDMVFNHVADVEQSSLERTVPGYYFRKNADGSLSNASGCGNEIASERAMASKMIQECILYWAREYRVDGFRLDLMGAHDIDLIQQLRKQLDQFSPGILLYGEGWTAGSSPYMESRRAVKANAKLLPGVGMFSDDLRDGVRGDVFQDGAKGFVAGNTAVAEDVRFGVVGGIRHKGVSYGRCRSKAPWAVSPAQSVNYVECHDNLTLRDKLAVSMPDASAIEISQMARFAAAILFTSQGMPFLHAGQEFLRSKPLANGYDHNSYRSGDVVNHIQWNQKTENYDAFSYYKGLIGFRKTHSALRLSSAKEVSAKLHFFRPEAQPEGLIAFQILTDRERLVVLYNGNRIPQAVSLPSGNWQVFADEQRASGEKPLYKVSSRKLLMPACAPLVLYRPNYAKTRRTLIAVGAAGLTVAAATALARNPKVQQKVTGRLKESPKGRLLLTAGKTTGAAVSGIWNATRKLLTLTGKKKK